MSLTPLSPVLEECLSASSDKNVWFRSKGQSEQVHFLVEKTVRSLLKGEKILIVVPDPRDLAIPVKILSKRKLAHLCLIFNEHYTFTEKERERFHLLDSLKELAQGPAELDNALIKCRELLIHLDACLSAFNEIIFDELSFKSVLHDADSKYIDMHPHQKMIDELLPTDKDEARKQMGDLEKLFRPRFNFYEKLDLLKPTIFTSPENISNAQKEIKKLKVQAFEAYCLVTGGISHQLKKIEDSIHRDGDMWENIYQRLQDIHFHFDNQTGAIGLDEALVEVHKEIKKMRILRPERIGLNDLQIHELLTACGTIQNVLENKQTFIEEEQSRLSNSLTPFNVQSKRLKESLSLYEKAWEDINQCAWITLHFEGKPLQIKRTAEILRETIDNLELMEDMVTDEEYCSFKLKCTQSGISYELIRYLSGFSDSPWQNTFAQLLMHRMLKVHFQPRYRRYQEWNQKYEEAQTQLQERIHCTIHNKWFKAKEDAIAQLKIKRKEVHNFIFEERQSQESNAHPFEPNTWQFLQTLLPITVVSAETLEEHKLPSHCTFDHVIYYHWKSSCGEIKNHHVKTKSPGTCITSDLSENLFVEEDYRQGIFTSEFDKPVYAQPFILMGRSEKYHQALQLSSLIMTISQDFHVYKLKNKVLISFLENRTNQAILDLLPKSELNVIYEYAHEEGKLVEGFISPDAELFVLLENDLINDKNTSSLSWQRYIINLLKDAQVKIISINTVQLYTNYSMHMREAVETITSSKESKEELVLAKRDNPG